MKRKSLSLCPGFRLGTISLFASCVMVLWPIQGATVEDYRLEVVAHSSDYPRDPLASNRQFGTRNKLNQAGLALFTAHWRDGTTGRNDSSVNLGRPAQATRVVGGTDPVPGYPSLVFAGRLDNSGGNFVEYTFNSAGELLFTGGVRHQDLVPTPPPTPFGVGLFKGQAGNFALLAATTAPYAPSPPLANVANAPYNGTGTLVFAPADGATTDGIEPIWLADNGKTFFGASLNALETNAFGIPVARRIVTGGLFEEQPTRRLILYPGAPAPGLTGEHEIVTFTTLSSVWGSSMGQKNGAFLINAFVQPLGVTTQSTSVFYEYRDGNLRPAYVQGDPLPDLPPLSEVLGTTEPYDIFVSLQDVDETGLGVFIAYANARNFSDVRPLGYWKTTTNGLALVLRFNQEYATPHGLVRFPAPPVSTRQRVAMGGGKVAFLTGFTGLGATFTTPGIFREVDGGFEMVAAAGLTVTGTRFTLGNDFIGNEIRMNASNEVAFFVSYRTNTSPSAPLVRALWVAGRDSRVRRVFYPGQQVGYTNSTTPQSSFLSINSAGLGTQDNPVFNDDGILLLTALFTNNTYAILRAVPPSFKEPYCIRRQFARSDLLWPRRVRKAGPGDGTCGEHFFWAPTSDNNWHAIVLGPRTNWEDSKQNPWEEPPGVAEPETATVFINAVPGETIVLNRQPTSIGSVNAVNGLLRLQQPLTLNQPSTLHDLRMEAPNGSLTINADATITNTFEWITGTVSGNVGGPGRLSASSVLLTNGTTTWLNTALIVNSNLVFDGGGRLILSNAVLRTSGTFLARTGTITNSSGASPVQNNGLLRKEGVGDFTIHQAYDAFEALLRIPPWGIEVDEGRLSLLGGGQFLGYHTNEIDLGAELELAGPFRFQPEYTLFRGNGTLKLGKPDKSVELRVSLSSKVEFSLFEGGVHFTDGVITGGGSVTNGGAFYWEDGVIGRADGIFHVSFQNGGELFIEEAPTPTPLRLEGPLVNSKQVIQRGDLEMLERVENKGASRTTGPPGTPVITDSGLVPPGEWKITQPADIRSANPDAIFVNNGAFVVEPQSPGEANVAVIFQTAGKGDPFVPGPVVICGKQDGPNPAFVLRFRRLVNYDPNGLFGRELTAGSWMVGPGCTLDFAGKVVDTIRESTVVVLNGGEMPSLELANNFGNLTFKNKSYTTPGELNNFGTLTVSGTSILTVDGQFRSSKKLECFSPAVVDVRGDAILDGRIDATGVIKASGVMTVNGIIQADGVLQGATLSFAGATVIVGSSPGVLNIIGSMVQSNSVLVMELYGTATNQYDQLIVSSNAQVGGTLVVNLVDGFRPAPGDSFPIVQATSITGQFANATNGQRIATIDGYGSIVVNYTPTAVVLSAFELNPTPPPTAPATLRAPTFGFDGTLELSVTGSPGRPYIIQTGTNLFDWLPLTTNIFGFDGALRLELPFVPSERQRFYRALSQ